MITVKLDTHLLSTLKQVDRLSKLDPNNLMDVLHIITIQGYLRAVVPDLLKEVEEKQPAAAAR